MKRAFVTGVSGYIGGSVARRLVQDGYEVMGLVRDPASAARVEATGVRPVIGGLDDTDLLVRLADEADLVINTADADHRAAVEALVDGMRGSGKTLVHTSGSSIVADVGTGERSEQVFTDDTPFTPVPAKAARVAIDRFVLDAAHQGICSIVVCPTMIYGRGTGSKRDSIQVPMLIRESQQRGAGVYIGEGRNIWSNVHIDDLVDLYTLVIDKAEPGSFFFAENGETSLREVALAIAHLLGFGDRTTSWPLAEAIAALGEEAAAMGLASNSRVRATHARALGWRPSRPGLVEDIERGSYRQDFGPG
ncbi:NAD-dependent epimerase/dehydratase family protein [Nannocystis sp. SCPEA4]|uniref:NAD-dependent epimerase/dehydratase family protein n=1 Tax=Nannocystis sp. SCPEA4 TaxID=2996787 RepID=UPI002270825B|nr:NAD-dependent epimerase/dehydratase family protein [Nannocystis sp. SCPEA4]MCY1053664.1 NAD-dependent epimerase/dehydratase family protein [Nannocystis sp. SCPEA4]